MSHLSIYLAVTFASGCALGFGAGMVSVLAATRGLAERAAFAKARADYWEPVARKLRAEMLRLGLDPDLLLVRTDRVSGEVAGDQPQHLTDEP